MHIVLFLSNLNQNWNVSINFGENPSINVTKNLSGGSTLTHADGWQLNSPLLQANMSKNSQYYKIFEYLQTDSSLQNNHS
jgi:hypothetical protein